jgi:hypothetical protein
LNVIPAGRVPPLKANAYGGVPPDAVTGVNDESAAFAVPTRLATACVVDTAGLIVIENVLDDVEAAASVAVTVSVVGPPVAVAVPLTAPVPVLKLRPDGSEPPLNAYVYGAVPPPATTGTNDGSARFTVHDVLGTACVVESGPLTVNWNVLDEVAPTASVTVTVYVAVARDDDGVPVTAPVLPLKLMPAGSGPPLRTNAYGGTPPLAVTGVNDGIGVPTVPVVDATACVVESAAATVNDADVALVRPADANVSV